MILIDLIDELKKELENLFKDNTYETKSNTLKTPNIDTGWYTSKNVNNEEYPYIMISPVEQNDEGDSSDVQLLIIFAAHSKDSDGWKDSALMAEKTKQHLETKYSIAEKYQITDKIKITFPDSQPYPQWFCWMDITFRVYRPSIDFEGVNY